MILGCICDDFTGAGDLAGILVEQGMRTSLFTEIGRFEPESCDAGVIALKTRSIPAQDAIAQSLAALESLLAAGCRQIMFKYCSTFDSTPQGNIGPVAQALAERLNVQGIVVCPAFPANGRTVYQGNLFVGSVPLAESGMRNHPLTPMTDSDIRRWLAQQTSLPVSHIPLGQVRAGKTRELLADMPGLVVVDAIDDEDLKMIGRAVNGARLLTGGSAIALGLPENFRRAGLIEESPVPLLGRSGPTVLLSGSCSVATNAQVAAYRENHPAIAIDVDRLLSGEAVLDEVDAFLVAHGADAPLAYSTAQPEQSDLHISPDGQNRAADAVEQLMTELAVRAVGRGVRKFIVAGGETSGAVVNGLKPGALKVGKMIAPGVPLLASDNITLALKSGNFGSENFLSEAVEALEQAA